MVNQVRESSSGGVLEPKTSDAIIDGASAVESAPQGVGSPTEVGSLPVVDNFMGIPTLGFDEPVALLRSESEASWQTGAKTLADWAAMDPQFAASGVVSALDKLKVPELLPTLLDGTSAVTQGAVTNELPSGGVRGARGSTCDAPSRGSM